MTGPEHYAEAERLIALARTDRQGLYAHTTDPYAKMLADAQIHATLALAAATALAVHGVREHIEDGQEWRKAAATKPNP
jgi:hypothetical protein